MPFYNPHESLIRTLVTEFYDQAIREDKLLPAVASLFVDDPEVFADLFPEIDGSDFDFFKSFWKHIKALNYTFSAPIEKSVIYLGENLFRTDPQMLSQIAEALQDETLIGTGVPFHVALAVFLHKPFHALKNGEILAALIKPAVVDALTDPLAEEKILTYAREPSFRALSDEGLDSLKFVDAVFRSPNEAHPEKLILAFRFLISFLYEVARSGKETAEKVIERYVEARPQTLSALVVKAIGQGWIQAKRNTTAPFLWYLAVLDLSINKRGPIPRSLHNLMPYLHQDKLEALFAFCVGSKERFRFLRAMDKEQFLRVADLIDIGKLSVSPTLKSDSYIRLLYLLYMLQGKLSDKDVAETELNELLRLLDVQPLLYYSLVNIHTNSLVKLTDAIIKVKRLQNDYRDNFNKIPFRLGTIDDDRSVQRSVYWLLIYKKMQESPFELISAMENRFYVERFDHSEESIGLLCDALVDSLSAAFGKFPPKTYKAEWARFLSALFSAVNHLDINTQKALLEKAEQSLPSVDRETAEELFADIHNKLDVIEKIDKPEARSRVVIQWIRDEEKKEKSDETFSATPMFIHQALCRGDWAVAVRMAETMGKDEESAMDPVLKQRLALARVWIDSVAPSLQKEYLIPILLHPHYGYGVVFADPQSDNALLRIYQKPPLFIEDIGVEGDTKGMKALHTSPDEEGHKALIRRQCASIVRDTIMKEAEIVFVPARSFSRAGDNDSYFLNAEDYKETVTKKQNMPKMFF